MRKIIQINREERISSLFLCTQRCILSRRRMATTKGHQISSSTENDASSHAAEASSCMTTLVCTQNKQESPYQSPAPKWGKKATESEEREKGLSNLYSSWSREQLISRLVSLEKQLDNSLDPFKNVIPNKKFKKEKKPHVMRPFDPSKYSTRYVAFKLAYLGKRYNGFEYHMNNKTPLPTIEEELWKAFTKAKLIFPRCGQTVGDWEGCEYSKCGRTDKGVSAFGQVISLRVRSNRPQGRRKGDKLTTNNDESAKTGRQERAETFDERNKSQITSSSKFYDTLPRENAVELAARRLRSSQIQAKTDITSVEQDDEFEQEENFDPLTDELPYASILNRLLPYDIRILAWCPEPPVDFSARFSCRERQYRYFFTQPCFLPIPHHMDPFHKPSSTVKDGYLDIDAMRMAAKLFEGQHDFRNLCKVDASKQLESFVRCIHFADIEEVPDSTSTLGFLNNSNFKLPDRTPFEGLPKIFTLTLHGSAFLWHQVRHMMAILFLIGQGLEKPSIVSTLLNVAQTPRRPTYQMAAETPLVLWDCIFTQENDAGYNEELRWIYVGDTPGTADTKYGVPAGGLMDDLWRVWRENKIDETLAANLLGLVSGQGDSISNLKARSNDKGKSQRIFDGSDAPRLHGTYIPVMKKPLMDSVDVINQRYAVRKGFESVAEIKEQGFRRLNISRPDDDAMLDHKD